MIEIKYSDKLENALQVAWDKYKSPDIPTPENPLDDFIDEFEDGDILFDSFIDLLFSSIHSDCTSLREYDRNTYELGLSFGLNAPFKAIFKAIFCDNYIYVSAESEDIACATILNLRKV